MVPSCCGVRSWMYWLDFEIEVFLGSLSDTSRDLWVFFFFIDKNQICSEPSSVKFLLCWGLRMERRLKVHPWEAHGHVAGIRGRCCPSDGPCWSACYWLRPRWEEHREQSVVHARGPGASDVDVALSWIDTFSTFLDSSFCLCVWPRSSEFNVPNWKRPTLRQGDGVDRRIS